MGVLEGLLPEDMLHYCDHSGILNDIVMPPDDDSHAPVPSVPPPAAAYDRSRRYIL